MVNDDITRRTAITGVGGLVIAAIAGCTEDDDDSDTANGDDSSNNGDGSDGGTSDDSDGGNGSDGTVEILDHEVVEPEFGSYIEIHGEIQNNTGEEQSYIEIEAVFFDSDGTRVDDSFTNFTDVPDGQTIAYELITTVEPDEFDTYELETSTSAI